MTAVVSRDNPRFKAIKRLAEQTAARKQSGSTILEGPHLCARYLERIGQPTTCVVAEGAMSEPEIAAILKGIDAARGLVLDDSLYSKLSMLDYSRSVLFVIDVPVSAALPKLTGKAVLIDRLQDPGNLGSILRTAAAAGIKDIYLSKDSVAAWSPKVLRAAMGAHFAITIHEGVDLLLLLEAATVPVLATSSHLGKSIYQVDLKNPVAWLFGNEGQGVEPRLLEKARPVSIPQPGGEESLNVAAAAAVCLFEAVRQGA